MKGVWIVVWLAVGLWAGPIGWMGDYRAALQRAGDERKPVLILLVEPKCTPCNRLLIRIHRDHGLSEKIERTAVPLLLSAGLRSYPIEMYYTTAYPALFLIDADERFLIDPIIPAIFSALRDLFEKEPLHER